MERITSPRSPTSRITIAADAIAQIDGHTVAKGLLAAAVEVHIQNVRGSA